MMISKKIAGFALLAGTCLLSAQPAPATAAAPLTQEQKTRHLLDRIGFGPRPGDVERVQAMGAEKYLEQQLHPDKVPDAALTRKVASLKMLNTPVEDLTRQYRDSRRQARQVKQQKAKPAGSAMQAAERPEGAAMEAAEAPDAKGEDQAADAVDPKDGLTQKERQARREYQQMSVRLVAELQLAKTMRAVESNRQLQEVMVDFWTNHFNIDVRKGLSRIWKPADDRDVIRPYALGKFRDLLGASAKSPAMLYYLDNFRSTGPPPQRRGRAARANAPKKQAAGLNENYGREIMELHTLGVDGGYTQKDVTEVARCFTGWTINPQTGAFFFAPGRHDRGEKTVLGRVIPAGGGQEDGEKVLDILASSPATARHLARALCMRFVSDTPPASVIDKAARTFETTQGDIAAVVKTIITSPEFNAADAYRAKVKSPFEYAVSAVRALDGKIVPANGPGRPYRQGGAARRPQRPGNAPSIVRQIATMGEPLFQFQAPTGYSENSQNWVSAGMLVSRMNYALNLTKGAVGNVRLPDGTEADADATPDLVLARLEKQILGGDVSESTRAVLVKQVKDRDPADTDPALLTALVLGAPEFQKR
jgi:uncharacterized protein (DUF1800 family)